MSNAVITAIPLLFVNEALFTACLSEYIPSLRQAEMCVYVCVCKCLRYLFLLVTN